MTDAFVALSPDLRDRLFTPAAWQRLQQSVTITGIDTTYSPERDGAAELVITGWDSNPLSDRISAPALIAHSGGSIRSIVPRRLLEEGTRVTQVAGVLAEAVAEFAVMAIISGLRRYVDFVDRTREGVDWATLAAQPPGRLLSHSQVGIVGASRTGLATIARLRPFGCRIVVFDPFLSPERAAELGVRTAGIEEVFATSDVVSLHAPLTASTRGMVTAQLLDSMPPAALLVNTARAGLIDDDALFGAVSGGAIRAVLDVLPAEPSPPDDPWRHLPGSPVTPHIAALTAQTLFAQGDEVVAQVEAFLRGEDLTGEIRLQDYDRIA